jgi:acyl dehydratase
MTTESRYLEDLMPGERWDSEPVTLTEDDIVQFARAHDAQPIHTDPEFAVQGPFGGLIASGWHLTALAMRLSVRARSFGGTPIIGAGVDELRWLRPVRPGDSLALERVFEQIDPPSRPGGLGTVRTRMTMRNQRGEKVMTMPTIGKIPVRPA